MWPSAALFLSASRRRRNRGARNLPETLRHSNTIK
ncbi:hypothetical protein [Phaeobacter sp. C3_T13_0]